MTLTETLKGELAKAGIPSTVRYGDEGDVSLELSDDVSIEVMPEMVELVTVNLPEVRIPPPLKLAELPEMVELVTVNLPSSLRIPPP